MSQENLSQESLSESVSSQIAQVDQSEEILSDIAEQEQEKAEQKIIEKNLSLCEFDCSSAEVRECLKCHKRFCPLHTSRISLNFCKNCFNNLHLIIDKFERRTESYDEDTDTVVVKSESCKRMRWDGPGWLFTTLWVNQLTDDEFKTAWEFHYFVLKLIEQANESRNIKKNKINSSRMSIGGGAKTVSGISVTTTTDKRTRKETKIVDPLVRMKKLFPGLSEIKLKKMMEALEGEE